MRLKDYTVYDYGTYAIIAAHKQLDKEELKRFLNPQFTYRLGSVDCGAYKAACLVYGHREDARGIAYIASNIYDHPFKIKEM